MFNYCRHMLWSLPVWGSCYSPMNYIDQQYAYSEAWYAVKEKDIKELEQVDEMLMKRAFKTPLHLLFCSLN